MVSGSVRGLCFYTATAPRVSYPSNIRSATSDDSCSGYVPATKKDRLEMTKMSFGSIGVASRLPGRTANPQLWPSDSRSTTYGRSHRATMLFDVATDLITDPGGTTLWLPYASNEIHSG